MLLKQPGGAGHTVTGQAPGCDLAEQDAPGGGALCGVYDLGAWAAGLPERLWHLATTGWSGLLLVAAVGTVLAVAVRVAHRVLWNRAVRGGYWLAITAPRTVEPGQAVAAWELLAGLVYRAGSGWWRLARPPLAFEIHSADGRCSVGVWLPGWVPLPVAAATIGQAWPGARTEPATPPTLTPAAVAGRRYRWAGWRLAATETAESGWLVNSELLSTSRATGRASGPTDGDALRAVWSSLSGTDATSGMVQVLVRPAPSRRVARLGQAARYPLRPRRRPAVLVLEALVWLVRLPIGILLELLTPGPSRVRPHRPPLALDDDGDLARPDRIEVRRMRTAGDKLTARPRLLATVRVAAQAPDRRIARAAARQLAEGFALVSRVLYPTRLYRAARVLAQRRAGRRDWLLVTAAELGTLARFPADPARYGFGTAAAHRPPPVGARRASPERASGRAAGWRHDTWTTPTTAAAGAGGGLPPVRLRSDPAHRGGDDPELFDNDQHDNDQHDNDLY